MAVVSLQEFELIDRVPLSAEAGWALNQSGIVTASPSRPPGTWRIKAKDHVGAVRIGDVELRITPKIPIERLFFLLGYQDGWDGWHPGLVKTRESEGLVAVVAMAFVRQIERALRQGPLRGYQSVEEALPTVRGRIRETAQLRRRFGFPLPVEVSYHDFTLDTAENRILLAAAQRLSRLPGVTQDTRTALRRIPARFVDVGPLRPGGLLPTWNRTRLNERFHTALALAELVLSGAAPNPGDGGIRMDGFILDMDQVFESFVTGGLAEALGRYPGRSRLQDKRHKLDTGGAIQLRPDLVWDDECGRPAAVVDAKYKSDKKGRYPSDDVYQMLAYCTRLGLKEGHLIYAAGPESMATRRIVNADIDIYCHVLDLSAQPLAVINHLSAIASIMARSTRM